MTNNPQFLIRKASGESELFDVSKLIRSLQKAGADSQKAESIANDISSSLYEGISTKKIYGMAFRMLRKHDHNNALLYKLKQSLFELGPTGYPFEQFIGEIYKRRGFSVEVAQILEGYSITHEMDVIATKNREQLFIECKYGNDQGKTISIQVPLYVRSRVNDIVKKRAEMPEYANFTFFAGLACNTRFSDDSIQYSKCNGISLLGWDYPQGNGLKEIMEQEKIFPITVLEQLTGQQKTLLMEQGIVTCAQLFSNMALLQPFSISQRRMVNIERELEKIL